MEDSRHGVLAATIAAAAGAKEVKPEDFMLGPRLEESREPEPDELVTKLQKLLPPAPAGGTPLGSPFGPDDDDRKSTP